LGNSLKIRTIAYKSKDWETYLLTFNGQAQFCLKAIAMGQLTANEIACLAGIDSRVCGTVMSGLKRQAIVVLSEDGYGLADQHFAQYLAGVPLDPLTKDQAITQTKAIIGKAMAPMLGLMENQGLVEDGDQLGMKVLGAVEKVLEKEIKG
jgi:hypothetical protein